MPCTARSSYARMVLADGGDYLVVVRGNQPQLLEELEVLFDSTRNAKCALKQRRHSSTTEGQVLSTKGMVELRSEWG